MLNTSNWNAAIYISIRVTVLFHGADYLELYHDVYSQRLVVSNSQVTYETLRLPPSLLIEYVNCWKYASHFKPLIIHEILQQLLQVYYSLIISSNLFIDNPECLVLRMPFVLSNMPALEEAIPHLPSGWIMLTVPDTKVLWISATSMAGE